MAEVGSTDNSAATTPGSTGAPASTPTTVVTSTPTSTARPGTAAASLEKVAKAAEPPSSSGNPDQPASGASPELAKEPAATVPSGQLGSNTDDWEGIPEGRRTAITRNLRESAAKEAREAMLKELGLPVDGYSADQVRAQLGLVSRFAADPVAFWRQLGTELAEAGHPLGGSDNTADNDPEPQPDMVSEDGKHKVYSDAQLRKLREWDQRQMEAKFLSHVNPMREFMEQSQNREHVTNIIHESRSKASEVLTEARKLPYFKENEKAIGEALAAIPKEVRAEVGSVAALYIAYNHVLRDKVFPTIGQKTEQEVRESLREKAAAGVGQVHVGSGQTPAAKAAPRNVDQLAARMKEMAGAGA